jgi:hypothetical protein
MSLKFLIELGRGLVEGALIAVVLYYVLGIILTPVQICIIVVCMSAISSIFGGITKALQKKRNNTGTTE